MSLTVALHLYWFMELVAMVIFKRESICSVVLDNLLISCGVVGCQKHATGNTISTFSSSRIYNSIYLHVFSVLQLNGIVRNALVQSGATVATLSPFPLVLRDYFPTEGNEVSQNPCLFINTFAFHQSCLLICFVSIPLN